MTDHCLKCGTETDGSLYCTWSCFQDDENAERKVNRVVGSRA